MFKHNSRIVSLKALIMGVDRSLLASMSWVLWKMLASLKQFYESKLSPESFQKLELRLERLGREFSKVLLQYALNHIESTQRPNSLRFEHRDFHPCRRAYRCIGTRLGVIRYCRWLYQNEHGFVDDIAPLDRRLGLIADRISPALADKLGRLAAELPQQAVLAQIHEQFHVRLSTEAYRHSIEHLSYEVRYLHDRIAGCSRSRSLVFLGCKQS